MNYHYAKWHAFIKKWIIDVIFRWLWRILCVVGWPSLHFLSVEYCPRDPTYTDCLMYISDKGELLIQREAMFYKLILFLVDYIAKKWVFAPKISKIRQYTEVIFPDTNALIFNILINKQLIYNFVRWNYGSYWHITLLFQTDAYMKMTKSKKGQNALKLSIRFLQTMQIWIIHLCTSLKCI